MRTLSYTTSFFALSDRGLVRPANEDAWQALPTKQFYAIADGLGGQLAGEIAAHEAVQEACRQVEALDLSLDQTPQNIAEKLLDILRSINTHIWKLSQADSSKKGMATTLSCMLLWKDMCIYGHVGDSRLYCYRDLELLQLTLDDSLVFELLQFGLLDEGEAKNFPLKHVITKSLGTQEIIEPTVGTHRIQKGDTYLLCTDGLHGCVEGSSIARVLRRSMTLEEKGASLLEQAIKAGGSDNITLILINIS